MSETTHISNPECPLCGFPTENPKPRDANHKPLDACWYRIRNYTCKGPDKHRFSTEESYKTLSTIYVKKSSGDINEFKFGKVMKGIQCAAADEMSIRKCKEISYAVMRSLSSKEATLNNGTGLRGRTFQASEIGEEVLALLYSEGYHKAWVRFALVFYKSDLGDRPVFKKIISVLANKVIKLLGAQS